MVSSMTAAASSITGKITDPRSLGALPCSFPAEPEAYPIDDELLIVPGEKALDTTVVKEPHIKELPYFPPLDKTLSGEVTLVVGDNITTDHIIPGGSYLRFRSDIARYAQFTFHQTDNEFPKRSLKLQKEGKDGIIIAGQGYGQGSSREHAALCPRYLGVRALIAVSIERIHQANLINYGIVPLLFKEKEGYEQIDVGDQLKIERVIKVLRECGDLVIKNISKKIEIPLTHNLNKREIEILILGGLINHRRTHGI